VSVVVVMPGQGSQTPGFLEPWLELPGARDALETYGAAAEVDLVAHGTVSDADTIRDTKVAQPLIVAASVLAWTALSSRITSPVAGVAGHSVGEIAAIAAAGILDEAAALRLVGIRGRAMAEAAGHTPTGMSAVLGADEAELLAKLEALGLEPANFNGGGQIVVGGALDALEALKNDPPAGARVMPLQVAGAFHTRYMAPAVETLRTAVAELSPADPVRTIWTNRDGSAVASGSAFLDLLVGQVASPVRWDLTMQSFEAAGITGLVELAPAGTLVGLAKRGLKGLPTVAVKTPDDLEAAVALIDGVAA